MAEDVAALHCGNESTVKMQIGAADRARGDADNRIRLRQDLRVGNRLDSHIVFAVPAISSHEDSFPMSLELNRPSFARVLNYRESAISGTTDGGCAACIVGKMLASECAFSPT